MDVYGVYERQTKNGRTGEETTDRVTLQADPVNRARYEAKGFKFQNYAPVPGAGPAVGVKLGGQAAEQVFGFIVPPHEDLDQHDIVKQAAEVALRKITGTYTQAEAEAESAAHMAGKYMPDEVPFAIVQGDPLEGFEKLVDEGDGMVNPNSPSLVPPAQANTPGADGSGAVAPTPAPAP